MAGGVRESAADIERELRAAIRAQASQQSELDEANAALAGQIKDFIQSQIPIKSGEAVGSIRVKELKTTSEHPLPGRMIYSDDPMFHMLEYGTKADESGPEPRRVLIDGTWVMLDRDTPTQALAPFGKARARFGDRLQ